MTPEDQRWIKDEIRRAINIILSGATQGAQTETESIANLWPGMPVITNRPTMHPYGFASSAPDGTIQVVAKQGEHPGNRVVLGHRDSKRPTRNVGETILYNAYGDQIRLENGKIKLGGAGSSEPFVLGNIFQAMMSTALQAIADHKHVDSIGGFTLVPTNAAEFTAQKSSPVDDKKILSDEILGRKS